MKEPLKLRHSAVIKEVSPGSGEGIIIIKGRASVYRKSDGMYQVDRDGEIMNLDFMDLESYKKNPILCFQHDWKIPAGRVIDIVKKDGALNITAEVHRLPGLEHIYEAVKRGIIKSFSVGTIPHQYAWVDGVNGEDILEIRQSELVEISLTTVQSNQEALFDVISEKSLKGPTISKQVLAKQNNMTCDELTGSCQFKAELVSTKTIKKEVEMVNKEPETEVKPEPKEEPKVEPKVEVKPEPKEEPKVEPKIEVKPEPKEEPKPITAEDMAKAIMDAQTKVEELRAQKEEEEKRRVEEEAAEDKRQAEARIQSAKDYIEETKNKILATSIEDFDLDSVDEFYQLVSDASEAIENKVVEIISQSTTNSSQA